MCLTRILIYILVCLVIGWLFCDIDPDETYYWYSGIWHAMFFAPNLVRSWFTDALYKANYYSDAYNFFWWLIVVIQVVGYVFGGTNSK